MSISVILSLTKLKRSTSASFPLGATTMPTAPSTNAGSANRALAENARALVATACALRIERSDYLLVYLVAAAELAVAVLSFGAIRITDWAALRLIVTTLVVLHSASGILDIVYMAMTEPNAVMISNTVLRFAVVAVFLVVWCAARRHHTPGTSR
jgi:hypothetical protein